MIFDESMLITIIGILSSVVVVSIGLFQHYDTKKKELEFIHRERKWKIYDELIINFTSFVHNPSDRNTTIEFIRAYNKASSYASVEVLEQCRKLLEFIKKGTDAKIQNRDIKFDSNIRKKENELINDIFTAIRHDVIPTESYRFKAFFG